MPHPDKAHRGGEDGYFACSKSRTFGIADGVGGWAESGIDPGVFARQLLRFAHESIQARPCNSEADLREALRKATTRLHQEHIQGGSTALLGQLNNGEISILNLGDSGLIVLRPTFRTPPSAKKPQFLPRVVFRSSDQTHYFNCPYQLSSAAAADQEPDFVRIRVRKGDILIAATDGLFDNLFDHQVQSIVAEQLEDAWIKEEEMAPLLGNLADRIAAKAQAVGKQEANRGLITPFAVAAHAEGLYFRGGKLDDTTLVIGLVCNCDIKEEDSSGNSMPQLHNLDV
eukprot:gnl/TRDRNA2_/TRDRNA2_33515_c0_seq1.p1 gnl/TRDRNA2_/TRDRNA2_33515_c0~~gnl/TRDRNA2_/TRDRNA2_33515_c0_seq1.p1  ORF type:complete len:317 (-),score=63.48 gnl/TRDRNA2_/TRDRNA2_33515_c0_seq1:56-910(-)